MADSVIITLTTAGVSTGPFNLYSNLDGFTTPFEINVSRSLLLVGYLSTFVPSGTTTIRVLSEGACTNYIDISITGITTSTTTTSTSTTSTTTTTIAPFPRVIDFHMEQFDDGFGVYWASAFITLDIPLTQNVNFNINFTFNGVTYTSASVPMGIGQTTIIGGYNVTGNQSGGGLVPPICIQSCVVYGTSVPANVNISTFIC